MCTRVTGRIKKDRVKEREREREFCNENTKKIYGRKENRDENESKLVEFSGKMSLKLGILESKILNFHHFSPNFYFQKTNSAHCNHRSTFSIGRVFRNENFESLYIF